MAHRFEAAHFTFPLPCWLMRDLGSIVKTPTPVMFDRG